MTKVKSKTYFTTAPVTPCKTKMRSSGLSSIITSSRKMGEKNIAEGEEITISTNIDEKEVVECKKKMKWWTMRMMRPLECKKKIQIKIES